jgi:hypothetical protein
MAENDRLHPDQASQGCLGSDGVTEHRAPRTPQKVALPLPTKAMRRHVAPLKGVLK